MAKTPEKQLAAMKRYRESPRGREVIAQYKNSREYKDAQNEYGQAWSRKNPEKYKLIHRKSAHKNHYGEPWENKAKRLEAQGGRCANLGCGTTEPGWRGWHTDHDHETGQIRGELCGGCNRALGLLKDDVRRAEGLADYVRYHRALLDTAEPSRH
jgi:hypothetical protein